MGSIVVREDEREFESVDWGQTKNLFGPESGAARYLKINITEYAPGGEHKVHRHRDQEEVIIVLDGEGMTKTAGGYTRIGPGSFVFVPANADHSTINVRMDKPLKAIIIKSPPREAKEVK